VILRVAQRPAGQVCVVRDTFLITTDSALRLVFPPLSVPGESYVTLTIFPAAAAAAAAAGTSPAIRVSDQRQRCDERQGRPRTAETYARRGWTVR
jgi:hypothetical protein